MGFMVKAEKQGQLPAKFKKKFASAAALMEERFGGKVSNVINLPQLSIRGGKFRIREDGEETVMAITNKRGKKVAMTELNVVLFDGRPNESNAFYDQAYDESSDEKAAPVCQSTDGKFPDSTSSDVQASACALCPKYKFGSSSTGKGRACRVSRRVILFVLDGEGEPVMKDDLPLALYMDIPVTSLTAKERKDGVKGFYQYVKELGSIGAPLEYVVTELAFSADSTYPKLGFEFVGTLDDDGIAAVDELKEDEDVQDAVDVDVEKAEGASKHALEADEDDEDKDEPKKPVRKPKPKKSASKEKPVVLEDEDDADDESDEDQDDELAEAAAEEIASELDGIDFDD